MSFLAIRGEFGKFVSDLGKSISEATETPDKNQYHRFTMSSDLPLPNEQNKWKIGKAENPKLEELDSHLCIFVFRHYKYDFDEIDFYCYVEGDKICFQAVLTYIK